MDKMSFRILRYLKKQNAKTSRKAIIDKFGAQANKSLSYLEQGGYIHSDKRIAGTGFDRKPVYISIGMYEITSSGLDFLEAKPGQDFDRWLNRISVLGSILGGALLSKPLWDVIDRVREWLASFL